MLFQYVIDPEQEKFLQAFIAQLETYVKSKSQAPFTVPLAQLAFLQEGLNELKLLNWSEIPVAVFRLEAAADADAAVGQLEGLMTLSYQPETQTLYVYPPHRVF
jgi:hypothetical protein